MEFSDAAEPFGVDSSDVQLESNANNMVSLQLSIAEVAGLRALIRDNEQRKTNDINNRIISDINIRTNIPKVTRNIEQQPPMHNNIRNRMYTTSENRPIRLFSEENNNRNRLNATINTTNSKKSNINIQKLTDIT